MGERHPFVLNAYQERGDGLNYGVDDPGLDEGVVEDEEEEDEDGLPGDDEEEEDEDGLPGDDDMPPPDGDL